MATRTLPERDRTPRERRKVAVIGSKVREILFGNAEPCRASSSSSRGLAYQGGGRRSRTWAARTSYARSTSRSPRLSSSTTSPEAHSPADVHGRRGRRQAEPGHRRAGARAPAREQHDVGPDDRRAIRTQNNLERFTKFTGVFVVDPRLRLVRRHRHAARGHGRRRQHHADQRDRAHEGDRDPQGARRNAGLPSCAW